MAFEALALGAEGWVSGLTNAFAPESLALYQAIVDGDLVTARDIYRWFLPLLHLDADHDLVQCIKMSMVAVGRGTERVRAPRHDLTGPRRVQVEAVIARALATRPKL